MSQLLSLTGAGVHQGYGDNNEALISNPRIEVLRRQQYPLRQRLREETNLGSDGGSSDPGQVFEDTRAQLNILLEQERAEVSALLEEEEKNRQKQSDQLQQGPVC